MKEEIACKAKTGREKFYLAFVLEDLYYFSVQVSLHYKVR